MDKRKGILAIIIFVVMTALAVFYLAVVPIHQRMICTEKAIATVVKVEAYGKEDVEKDDDMSSDIEGEQEGYTYSYIYRFFANGKKYTGHDYRDTRSNAFIKGVGDKQIIRYDKSNPHVFMTELGFVDFLLMLVSLAFVAVTIMLIQKVVKIDTTKPSNKDIFSKQ
jgi:hypothetical protein